MLYNPFAHAYAVRERAARYEREAAVARLLSAPAGGDRGRRSNRFPPALPSHPPPGAGPPR